MKIRRLLFAALWILSLAAITNFGGAVSYGFFFGMTMIPVISLIYMACVYFQFKIYQEIGGRTMVCGQPESYFFVLQNESYFAFTSVSVRLFSDFSSVEELPGDTEYELLPGDRFTFETRIMCKYRGEYEVGVKEVLVTDFLRLFRVRYANPGTIKALVNPKVVRLTELKSVEDFQALLQKETPAGTEPDVLVRDYVEGDSMNRIHWKATAREGKLKTRTRTGEEKQGIGIFCDMTRYDTDRKAYLPLENKMLETLLALGFFFAGKEMPFSVYYAQNHTGKAEARTGNTQVRMENAEIHTGKVEAHTGNAQVRMENTEIRTGNVQVPTENAQALTGKAEVYAGKAADAARIPRGGQEGKAFSGLSGQSVMVKNQVRGIRDFDAFYREIAGVAFREKEDVHALLEEIVSGGELWSCRAVFFILHRLDDRILEVLERLNGVGMVTVVYVIADGNQEAYLRQSNERRRIVVIPIEADLEGVL